MRPLELGLILPTLEDVPSGDPFRWSEIRKMAIDAETAGFDTVWVPDELLWKVPDWEGPRGFWECVAVTAAVAASTSRVKVGTWVLSALHRNPGLTAKAVSTLDEIGGGRFIFGFGAGHSGGQGATYGYPPDYVVSRYEESLEIIVPALREGRADFEGRFHRASDLVERPRGPRQGDIPIMLGGHKQRTIGLAVKHADIWSAFATTSSLPEAFGELIADVDRECEEAGRDPNSLGRSIGVFVETGNNEPSAEDVGLGVGLSGSPEEIVERVHQFAAMGVTMLELDPFPANRETFELLTEVVAQLDR